MLHFVCESNEFKRIFSPITLFTTQVLGIPKMNGLTSNGLHIAKNVKYIFLDLAISEAETNYTETNNAEGSEPHRVAAKMPQSPRTLNKFISAFYANCKGLPGGADSEF